MIIHIPGIKFTVKEEIATLRGTMKIGTPFEAWLLMCTARA